MQVQDMQMALNRRVDDVTDFADALEWFNSGMNVMAQRVGAVFPQLTKATDSPVFPAKYHEIPIMYAAAKYKERDSSLSEVQNFMGQFENAVKDFVRYYSPDLQYRDDPLTQVFTATAGQLAYVITKTTFDPTYGDLQVFYNGRVLQPQIDYTQTKNTATNYTNVVTSSTTTNDPNGFVLSASFNVQAGDLIVAIWEEHEDYVNPPYDWWRAW